MSRLLHRRAKTRKSARWTSDQSESEEEPSSEEESILEQSEKATSPRRSSSVPSETGQDSNKEEEGGEPSEREKKFGRKARAKAQVSHMRRDEIPRVLIGRKGKDKQASEEECGTVEKVLTCSNTLVLIVYNLLVMPCITMRISLLS